MNNTSPLEGYRKLIAMFLPVVVGAINGLGTLPNIPVPKDYTWETLGQWALTVVISFLPTIITLIASAVYTGANVKTKEIYAQAPAVTTTTATNSTVASSAPVYYPVAQPVQAAPVAAPVVQVAQIKDRIASTVKMINRDTKWDFLMGIWVDKVESAKQHLLAINNGSMSQDDMDKILAQYAGGVLNEDDCRNVQSVMGLPQVLHAQNDVLILQSMQAAEKAGTLGGGMSDTYLKAAIRGVSKAIIDDGINRVQNDSAPIATRRLALQEFGLPQDVADRAMFSGGACDINWMGGWRPFNGYSLAGFDTGI